jgi:hypothetical protein
VGGNVAALYGWWRSSRLDVTGDTGDAGDRGVGLREVSDAVVGTWGGRIHGRVEGNTKCGGRIEKSLQGPLWEGTMACRMIASAALDARKQRLVECRWLFASSTTGH